MRSAAHPPAPLQEPSSPMPSLMVLDRVVDLIELDDTPRPGWESIYFSSKKAYGCGIYGRKVVEGLALYVHRNVPADLVSSLSIRLSDEALGSIRAELGDPNGRLEAQGTISNVSQQLLVVVVMFRSDNGGKRLYCLVFDSADASLCMVPFVPSPFEACYTLTVIPLRAAGEKDHELTLMVRDSSTRGGWCRLCVCTPATRANSASGHTGPWKVTEELCFPQLSPPLSLDVMFSFQGKVFWGDLTQGIVYCDLGTRDCAPKFNIIRLPKAYRIHWDMMVDEPREWPSMSRTMGCDGDSIKFICIDSSRGRGNEMVKVWTLDLDNKRWEESKGILWKKLWKKVNFMQAKLGDVVPQYPTLMPNGALCLLCKKARSLESDLICSFDMHSKSLLASRPVIKYDTMGCVVTPYNFFTMCKSPPLRKRKLPLEPSTLKKKLPALKRKKLPSHETELPALKNKLPTHKRKLPTILKETAKSTAWSAQQGRN